jgi:hypothetical protein
MRMRLAGCLSGCLEQGRAGPGRDGRGGDQLVSSRASQAVKEWSAANNE